MQKIHLPYKFSPLFFFLIFSLFCRLAESATPDEINANQEEKLRIQDKLLNEEYRRSLQKTEKIPLIDDDFQFTYGGWVSNIYRKYRNLDNDSSIKDWVSSIWTADVRLWGKLVFLTKNDIYVRIRDAYSDRKNVSDYTGKAPGWDNDGPHLDMGYLTLNANNFQARLGRQYFSVGRGIAYSDIHDGAQFRAFFKRWSLKTFVSRTKPHEENIDYSVPGFDKKGNNRVFYGIEAAYMGIPNNAIYAFFLNQRDFSHSYPEVAIQDFRYNSRYIGTGITGRKANLSYWGEVIKEFGRTHTDAQTDPSFPPIFNKKYVDSWAGNTGVRYEFNNLKAHPATEIEFAYGEGDKYRTSPTNTRGGRSINSGKDKNFLYFGDYYAGYALAPRLSNLYIYKVEQSVEPFYFTRRFRGIAIGVKYFWYYKANKFGGISDSDAELQRSFVGREIDFYFYWQLKENLQFITRYGHFHPENAYSQDKCSNTDFLYSQLTLTF